MLEQVRVLVLEMLQNIIRRCYSYCWSYLGEFVLEQVRVFGSRNAAKYN